MYFAASELRAFESPQPQRPAVGSGDAKQRHDGWNVSHRREMKLRGCKSFTLALPCCSGERSRRVRRQA